MFPFLPAYDTWQEAVISMHRGKSGKVDPYRTIAGRIDDWTVSIALGCVTMLVLVQGISQVPIVHRALDNWRSGFVTVQATPQNVATQAADVELSLAPVLKSANVAVLIDGKKIIDFGQSTTVSVTVRATQHITIQNQSAHVVYVTVDQSDEKLLVPAPGQRVIVSPNSLANFPATTFQGSGS